MVRNHLPVRERHFERDFVLSGIRLRTIRNDARGGVDTWAAGPRTQLPLPPADDWLTRNAIPYVGAQPCKDGKIICDVQNAKHRQC